MILKQLPTLYAFICLLNRKLIFAYSFPLHSSPRPPVMEGYCRLIIKLFFLTHQAYISPLARTHGIVQQVPIILTSFFDYLDPRSFILIINLHIHLANKDLLNESMFFIEKLQIISHFIPLIFFVSPSSP